MGRIKLIAFLFLLQQFVVSTDCQSQQKDTIYVIDLTINNGKSKQFSNKGTVAYLNGDSVKLVANKNSTKIQMLHQKQVNFTGLRIECLRIIKNDKTPLTLRVKSEKTSYKITYPLDTILHFDSKTSGPFIYWTRIWETPKWYAFFNPTHLLLTNEDFAYKKNYLRPKIRAAIMNSVVYEYHYPEGRLIRVKE